MTSSIPIRQQPHPVLPDRRSSLSSAKGSHKSSNSFSHTSGHRKNASSASTDPRSTRSSKRSSQNLPTTITIAEDRAQPKRRRLKSQYPLNSVEPHVEYILVASFDIDRGPTMEHQYPGAISPDENMLAELMLPDQTHMRKQDWTMFFLHKDPANAYDDDDDGEEAEERRQLKKQRKALKEQRRQAGLEQGEEDLSEDSSDDEVEQEGPSLMYVLNLVNTKHDPTATRGAVVKAMAICTRHSFLHIYKPLLLLALEDYFRTPTQDTLAMLYNSLNAMDLSLMPRLSLLERRVLQANDVKDLFTEKFERMIQQRADEDSSKIEHESGHPDSPSKNLHRQSMPRDTHEFESKIVYNGIPVPVKIPTAPCAETVGDFSLVQLVQTFHGPHVTQPQPFALHPHLTTGGAYTHPILVLINAMLTEKRVIFLGHNRPSGEVAEAVLAACALASGGVLRGFTRHAFPYTDLTKIEELLKVPGFIAGVTNPAFSYHPEWWDLLVDIPSGRMKISSSIEPAPVTEGSSFFQQNAMHLSKDNSNDATGDTAFMEDIMQCIESRQGESVIRNKFRGYITKFARIAASFEETVYGASSLAVLPPTEIEKPRANGDGRSSVSTSTKTLKGHGYVWPTEDAKFRELAATAAKIEGWRNTRSYFTFIQDLAAHSRDPSTPLSPVDVFHTGRIPHAYLDIYHCLSKLRLLRLSPAEAGQVFVALESYCDDYDSVLELLEQAPLADGGLFYISLGLWHEDAAVRESTAVLLERIRNHAAGRIFFARLGGFASVGFQRIKAERESRLHVEERS